MRSVRLTPRPWRLLAIVFVSAACLFTVGCWDKPIHEASFNAPVTN